ncbi:MAG TPA: hydantoinase/oxoprolinase family protein, partial [Thermoleophilaceae bacterium]
AGGALRVGPRSAGAVPGPAAYGRGGTEPTVTDANLLLGYLDATSPLAGGVELDRDAAERAVGGLAGELGLSTIEAAEGIVRVASSEMARAVRVMTVERGTDPRELVLLPFGGAGPLHAAAIAEELDMTRVIVPRASGVLSALGLLVSERRRDLVESVLLSGDELAEERVADVVERLAERGREELSDPTAEVRAAYDLRYRGQAFELTVDGEPAPDPADLRRAFEAEHERRYGYADPDAQLELVTVRVAVALPGAELAAPRAAAEPTVSEREVTIRGERLRATIHRGSFERVEGPAICELAEATLVVPPGWSGGEDVDGTISIERR